jgi:hypothetical protein
MLKLMALKACAIAAVVGATMVILTPAAGAKDMTREYQTADWRWGPEGCVKVRSRRSRETRYGGAPRCRRVPV